MGMAVLRREAAGLDEVPPRAPRPSKLVIEELRLERVSECTARIRRWIHDRGGGRGRGLTRCGFCGSALVDGALGGATSRALGDHQERGRGHFQASRCQTRYALRMSDTPRD